MKKWEMLQFQAKYKFIEIHSTSPDELRTISNEIVTEGIQYFSYVNKKNNILKFYDPRFSAKGHSVIISFEPEETPVILDDSLISIHELYYFILNILISHDWLPYPGNGTGDRFIKYHD